MERGYGVSALVNPELIAPLARAAEEAGYQTFWVNDVPGGNGLERLSRAQQVTSLIRLGVGVLPVDRWNAQSISDEIARLDLDLERLVVGIGAGTFHKGSLDATAEVASSLISRVRAKVLIGALGPRMCRLAGSEAHGVLLNWLTPGAAEQLALLTREGAAAVGRPTPEIVAYVRTAADPNAQPRLEQEASAYEGYPSYARHFARMGVRAIETTVNGSSSEIDRRFRAYAPATNEVVARAIAASDGLDDYLAILRGRSTDRSVMEPFESRDQALAWARDLVRRTDVLYLDTETTGVRFGFDDVIDIGIVDGRGIVVMDQLVRPSVAIPSDSEAVHGISNRAVSSAPRLPEIWSELSRILNGHIVVSYNATFDEQMLFDAGARRGLTPIAPARWDCAMEAFAAYNGELSHHRPGFRWINLGAAARILGLETPEHRAVSDAMLCLELVQELSRRK